MDEIVHSVVGQTVASLEIAEFPADVSDLSDEALLLRCSHYGQEARKWRNKFLGLLPEVARRRLYEAKGFGSIFHFAFVIGGVSGKQVERVLHLHERLRDVPKLQILLEKGRVSIHMMERVASVAEPKNQTFLADQVQMLSKKALDTLVKDEKRSMADFSDVREVEPSHIFILAEDVERQLAELHEKGIDVNGELREFLRARSARIAAEKDRLGKLAVQQDDQAGRYISVEVKSVLEQEYGSKCSINGCKKPYADIHHQQRFGYVRRHDPRFMAPLCREHHQIAHSIDVKVQEMKKSRPP